jgi:16S rRNA (guanine527-N7)-methyltransferase
VTETDDRLASVLADAQRLGLIGPRPIAAAVEHARRFAAATPAGAEMALDLGSGGGLPGLVVAVECPEMRLVLLDASERRTTWLGRAVHRLGLGNRVEVVASRAEEFGRDPARRGAFDAVYARGFGPPAVTAECAAPLLRVGGTLIVSEPPTRDEARWDRDWLEALGLARVASPPGLACFRQAKPCPSRFPRNRVR